MHIDYYLRLLDGDYARREAEWQAQPDEPVESPANEPTDYVGDLLRELYGRHCFVQRSRPRRLVQRISTTSLEPVGL